MAPKFGTSGLRGLVVELTAGLVAEYTRAFIAACPTGGAVHVGRDLRPSSPEIAGHVLEAVRAAGLGAVDCGAVSTPALALGAMAAGHAAIMVTGSHIPADRNGLKFYLPTGEIGKAHEAQILGHLGMSHPVAATSGTLHEETGGMERYVARYVGAFGPAALSGLRIGIYQHSSVARDAMVGAVTALGATAVPLAWSEQFIPVDTEAVDPDTRARIRDWCATLSLDALLSSDGDADRPLMADAEGTIVPGDVLGVLTARALGADRVVTPVSSNSMFSEIPEFSEVVKTKIGSPYVIAGMEAILSADPAARAVGYEANGGFLLGFAAQGPAGVLPPLMTRDSLLPLIAPLSAARARGQSLAQLVADLPRRFTAADRLSEIPPETSAALIRTLSLDPAARAAFFADLGVQTGVDLTDGLRVSFEAGRTVHLRPSGNAPECRCYAEADSPEEAARLVQVYLDKLARAFA